MYRSFVIKFNALSPFNVHIIQYTSQKLAYTGSVSLKLYCCAARFSTFDNSLNKHRYEKLISTDTFNCSVYVSYILMNTIINFDLYIILNEFNIVLY